MSDDVQPSPTASMSHALSVTHDALMLACRRLADGPQTYEEANTPQGWYNRLIEEAGVMRGDGGKRKRKSR